MMRASFSGDSLGPLQGRFLPRRHFVEHRTQGKHVGAGIELFTASLFRRHVGHRSSDDPRVRKHLSCFRWRPRVFASLAVQLGKAEIQYLDLTSPRYQKEVRRLDVSVKDPSRVRSSQSFGNLGAELRHLLGGHGLRIDPVLERLPFEKLHHHEAPSFVLPDVVEGADVRMAERRRGTRLPLEPLDGLGIARKFLGKKLDRHLTSKPRVLGPVDDSLSTAPEPLPYHIVGDSLAEHFSRAASLRQPLAATLAQE